MSDLKKITMSELMALDNIASQKDKMSDLLFEKNLVGRGKGNYVKHAKWLMVCIDILELESPVSVAHVELA